MRAQLLPALLLLGACADPSEVQALKARRAGLTRELALGQELARELGDFQRALAEVPLAGVPVDAAEVARRVTQATPGVAVTVEREAAGIHVALQGAAAPPRAALTLRQLSAWLPDLQLEQVELEPGRFLAHGTVADPAPPPAPAPEEGRTLIPRSEVTALREEVARLEQALRELEKVAAPDTRRRGPAAVRALSGPDRVRHQSRLLQAVAGFAATARVRYQGRLAEVSGTLLPGRKVMEVLPALKADHELLSVSGEQSGQFALKLGPRATAER